MNKPENQILVIFGASGDLAKRKLIPALYDLFRQDLLPECYGILGVGRTAMNDDSFRDRMKESLTEMVEIKSGEQVQLRSFLTRLHYISIDTKSAEDYHDLKHRLYELQNEHQTNGNTMYYLATPPSMYEVIADNLTAQGLNHESEDLGWKRLIIEKPFGYDLASAQQLNRSLLEKFRERQLYRIDHYLGKETVQNVMVTRFANGIFEPLWNRNYIHHVEITSAEKLGVEGRGGYYEGSGAMRDMIQNHLLQIASLTAMEPPSTIDAVSMRNERLKIFQALRSIPADEVAKYVIRGQYTASTIRGEAVPGYREEEGVDPESRTETFVAMKFFIDNWRWGGVPFYLRTGKRMPTKVTEVVIHFRQTPHPLFNAVEEGCEHCNQLILRIQPDEGILLKFGMKVPGAGFNVRNVNMDFHYADFQQDRLPDSYERLLLDAMHSDPTLYLRGDAVEACWRFLDPVLKAWKDDPSVPLHGYPAGTWGPEITKSLFDEPGADWRYPCKNLADDGSYCEL